MRIMERFTGNVEESRYLSPGAINAFADCSLRFYFRYVARIPEPVQIAEEIDMAVFGSLMHKSAQLIYEPYAGSLVSAEDIGSLLADGEMIEQYVHKAFDEVMSGEAFRNNNG
jgi:RecB family exonuclease